MNKRLVLRVAGALLWLLVVMLSAPLALAVVDGDRQATIAFSAAAIIAALAAAIFREVGRPAASAPLHRKDAFGIVGLIWVCLGVLGAIPLYLESAVTDVPGAIFEAVSGFTTTGATVIGDIDALSRATNLWRCLMHWIGGMGIVVLFVAVFPQLGIGGKQLFRTEVPGPTSEGLKPRIRRTALTLWWIYSLLTLTCAAVLWQLGMGPYDAVCHAFSTLGTGGFSTKTASVGHWNDAAIHWTTTGFMMLAGLNFGLYYALVQGRWRQVVSNSELRFYLAMNAIVIAVVAVSIAPRHGGVLETLQYASFQTAAVTTTTGFMTEDFDTYPNLCRFLLFGAMFMGGCAGSTSGGLKAVRVLLLLKVIAAEVRSAVHPHTISAPRLGGRAVPPEVISGVLIFAATYLALFAAASIAMVALGLDLLTGMSASIACLSSIGPGLDGVGPSQNFAAVPGAGKIILATCMVAGRLELFALFALFSPECWRR